MNEINKITQTTSSQNQKTSNNTNIGDEFARLLKNSIEEQNITQQQAEAAMTDIATGEVKDLHQAAIAINKADMSMKFMLEVRNKAINAYKEITRTQI
ncbi:flagellar hook-basal body complex protein FliE [Campylobacter troglodytis]|uniref:flagellar hook-basal body complex protein FliE n=1 Tax=Campylobacter troglodytis TaxID=654363 RepID=UPI00115B03B7|nr:flagellar hook-basal body complex protein FliE [Campylobacter troglodytis]TQR53766.1 flagellar hook-basal body complex protein FliE [Campylobacter troglodytis]